MMQSLYISLFVSVLIVIVPIWIVIKSRDKIYEMSGWFFVGIINTMFYVGVLAFGIASHHILSVYKTVLTLITILTYLVGYHVIGGWKYGIR